MKKETLQITNADMGLPGGPNHIGAKIINYISQMGYRDDSPFRKMSHIDIHTPTGVIDMTDTSIPIMANGRLLPPNSGQHQFDSQVVREVPLKQQGGAMHQMPDGSWMPGEKHTYQDNEDDYEELELDDETIAYYRKLGYNVEEINDEYQTGGNILYVDPNDPASRARYNAYQDSIGLYNYSNKLIREGLGYKSFSFPENPKLHEDYNIPYNPTGTRVNSNNEVSKIGIAPGEDGHAGINYRDIVEKSLKTKNKPLGWTYSDAAIPVYKKPVQPIKYKPDPEIVAKQQRLIDAGYDIGKADGIWGPKSQAAWDTMNAKQKEEKPKTQDNSKVILEKPKYQGKDSIVEQKVYMGQRDAEGNKIYVTQQGRVRYQDGGSVISEYGWDYTKEGDQYLTRKTGTEEWIPAKGNALNAIKEKVYKEPVVTQPINQSLQTPQLTGAYPSTKTPQQSNSQNIITQPISNNSVVNIKNPEVLEEGYLPVLTDYGQEQCTEGKECSYNTSKKLQNLMSGTFDKNDIEKLWAENAWFNKDKMIQDGGSLIFSTDERDVTKMPEIPKELYSKLQVGDYVQMNRAGDTYENLTKPGLKNEKVEHLGFIIGKDEDGTPLVWHGSKKGKAYVQRIDGNLSLTIDNNEPKYKIASIVRNPVLKNLNEETKKKIESSAYYIPFKKDLKLKPTGYATETQVEAVNAVNSNMKKFKDFGYKQDEVALVGQILAGGIMQQETEGNKGSGYWYRTFVKQPAAYIGKDLLDLDIAKSFEEDQASWGVYQMKADYNFKEPEFITKEKKDANGKVISSTKYKNPKYGELNDRGKKLQTLGVHPDDIFDSVENQTIAGELILLDNFNELKNDPKYDSKTGLWDNKIPASYILAKSWQAGSGWQNRDKYKEYINDFDITYSNNALSNAHVTTTLENSTYNLGLELHDLNIKRNEAIATKEEREIDKKIASGELPWNYRDIKFKQGVKAREEWNKQLDLGYLPLNENNLITDSESTGVNSNFNVLSSMPAFNYVPPGNFETQPTSDLRKQSEQINMRSGQRNAMSQQQIAEQKEIQKKQQERQVQQTEQKTAQQLEQQLEQQKATQQRQLQQTSQQRQLQLQEQKQKELQLQQQKQRELQQAKNMQTGGEFVEMEMDENAINYYKSLGYNIEVIE